MKKALSLVLAVLMVLGMTSVAFATVGKDAFVPEGFFTADDLRLVPDGGELKDVYYPGDKIKLYIIVGSEDNGEFYPYDAIDKSVVDLLKLTAQVKVAGSGTYIKDTSPPIQFEKNTEELAGAAFIILEFINPFVSTSSKTFEMTAYLRSFKAQVDKSTLPIDGTFQNYGQNVAKGDDYVFGVDYPVITADDNIPKIQVELGYGLRILTRMTDGKKSYGHVSMTPTAADDAIMGQYPNIVEVYHLQTINLSPAGDVVTFPDDAMFAYTRGTDGEIIFVGRTNKALPYYTVYFLSTVELDLPVAEVEEPVEDVVPDVVPDVVENANDNPGTGC
jgi:hypothetical protein